MNTKIKSVSVDENKNKKCFGSVNNELIEHPPPLPTKKKINKKIADHERTCPKN